MMVGVTDMESDTMKLNKNTGKRANDRMAFMLPALLRLALLVGPPTAAILLLAKSPIVCVVLCVAILWLWLSVDIGPFRASNEPAPARRMALPSFRNLSKAQWWSSLFCRIIVLFALFHSKLNI